MIVIEIDPHLHGVRIQHGERPEACRLFDYDDLRRSRDVMRHGCVLPEVVVAWLDEVHAYASVRLMSETVFQSQMFVGQAAKVESDNNNNFEWNYCVALKRTGRRCGNSPCLSVPVPLCSRHLDLMEGWFRKRTAQQAQDRFDHDGWTYIVRRRDGAYKIGRTSYPAQRFLDLKREHGPLEIMCLIPGGRHEGRLHREFDEHAIGHEWFRECPDLLDFIKWNAYDGPIDNPEVAERMAHAAHKRFGLVDRLIGS
jgi:hypothetical protein